MRLLVADKMDLSALEELKVLGIEIISRPELTKETLPSALDDWLDPKNAKIHMRRTAELPRTPFALGLASGALAYAPIYWAVAAMLGAGGFSAVRHRSPRDSG